MKKMIKKLSLVLCAFIAPALMFAQNDFDVYNPMIFTLENQYQPISGGSAIIIPDYRPSPVPPTFGTLKSLIAMITRDTPLNISVLQGNYYSEYLPTYESCKKKGKSDDFYLGKKKSMKYLVEDYKNTERFLYRKDSLITSEKKLGMFNDSLARRKVFINDSLNSRKRFIQDSIETRNSFICDSLYRADFRKTHNYDYVIFDGPHGNPVLCYRKGQPIDGKTYNEHGLLEKEYNNGVLIHDYLYSEKYVKAITNKYYDPDDWADYTSYYAFDKARNQKFIYRAAKYVREGRLGREESYNAKGLLTKEVEYKVWDSGIELEKFYLEYYPDNKTVKRMKVIYHDDKDIRKNGNVAIMDFYSNEERRESKFYRLINSNQLVLKEVWKYKGGYADVEYYDFDGKLERQSTVFLR